MDETPVLKHVNSLLLELRLVLTDARANLSADDRVVLARETRKSVANVCAEVDWILLGKLNTCDRDVLDVLIDLEPAPGIEWRTTGYEIWQKTRHCSQAVVYVALRRLDYLGLIKRTSGRGHEGTRVRLNWDSFTVIPLEEAA